MVIRRPNVTEHSALTVPSFHIDDPLHKQASIEYGKATQRYITQSCPVPSLHIDVLVPHRQVSIVCGASTPTLHNSVSSLHTDIFCTKLV